MFEPALAAEKGYPSIWVGQCRLNDISLANLGLSVYFATGSSSVTLWVAEEGNVSVVLDSVAASGTSVLLPYWLSFSLGWKRKVEGKWNRIPESLWEMGTFAAVSIQLLSTSISIFAAVYEFTAARGELLEPPSLKYSKSTLSCAIFSREPTLETGLD